MCLKGFQGFLGGLDNEKNMTGEYSVSTEFADLEVMFHVAPLMPYDPNDPQQVTYSNPIIVYMCVWKYLLCVFETNPSSPSNTSASVHPFL